MKRVVATLAGLALVGIPAAISMATTEPAASRSSAPTMVPAYQQVQSAPSQQHRGRHCHRFGNDTSVQGKPQV